MRIKEIIFEAAYDSMVISLKKSFPNDMQYIDQLQKKAKETLKKSERVVWFLRILKAELIDKRDGTNTSDELFGNYKKIELSQLLDTLEHYYGFANFPVIDSYLYGNQTVEKVLYDLNRYEDSWKAKQDQAKPVTPQEGDYKLIDFGNENAWWFVNRGYCSDEGRSGKHCGNVVGKKKTDQRILSYRQGGHVLLTFILLPTGSAKEFPTGSLGEMKAKNNQKPLEKFHDVVMSLLLSKTVTGIKGGGYAPEMNFSVFDLNDDNLKILLKKKPKLISDQIKSNPQEFIKAPQFIKDVEKFRAVAIKKKPALVSLLDMVSDQNWEDALSKDIKLIIYAPPTIKNYHERMVKALIEDPELIQQAPREVSYNTSLLMEVIAQSNGSCLKYIHANTPDYKKLCIAAIDRDGANLYHVSEDFIDYDLGLRAVKNSDGMTALYSVPEEIRDKKMYRIALLNNPRNLQVMPKEPLDAVLDEKLCLTLVQQNGNLLSSVPEKFRTEEVCDAAVKQNGIAILKVPPELPNFFDLALTALKQFPELLQYHSVFHPKKKEIYFASVTQNGKTLEFIPKELRDHDLCLAAVKQNGNALSYVPKELRDYEISLIAVKQEHSLLSIVPPTLRKQVWSDVNKEDEVSQVKDLAEKIALRY